MTFKVGSLEKYINRVAKQPSLPPVPDAAERFMLRGQTFLKEGYPGSAVRSFEQAIQTARWWADAYHNLAVAYESLKKYKLAVRFLQYYVLVNPDAPDADAMRRKSYELEAQADAIGNPL